MLCEDVGATCMVLHLLLKQRKSKRETDIQMIDHYDTIAFLGEMLLRL